jgi:membrane protein required for beta-lactamase induction
MQPLPQPPANLFARILAFLLSAALIVAGVMFSLVFLAIAAVAGICIGIWFWWKTRALRRDMRAFNDSLQAAARNETSASEHMTGEIIEGEFQREGGAPHQTNSPSKHLPEPDNRT